VHHRPQFQGLEADVVILSDFSGLGSLFTVSDLYVALTRARSHLIIIAHDRAAKERLDAALARQSQPARTNERGDAWAQAIAFSTADDGGLRSIPSSRISATRCSRRASSAAVESPAD